MRINHQVTGSKDPLITKDGLASLDLATMPMNQVNNILENDYTQLPNSKSKSLASFEVDGPLVDAINNCPFVEIMGMVDQDGNKIDFTPKGEIKSIYCYENSHIAILDTGKPCILHQGVWKPMNLVEEPKFKD